MTATEMRWAPGAGSRPPEVIAGSMPRTYLDRRVGPHGEAFWQGELPLMLTGLPTMSTGLAPQFVGHPLDTTAPVWS